MLYFITCLFYISHAHNTSSTFSGKHCLPDQSYALLQLKQEFGKGMSSDHFVQQIGSYPKLKSWNEDTIVVLGMGSHAIPRQVKWLA